MTGGLQSALDPAGPGAARIHDLFLLFTFLCTLVFVAVVAVLVWAVFRRRRGVVGDAAAHPREEQRLARAVGGAAALTVAILIVFLIASFWTDRGLARLAGSEGIGVQVIGHQWWWEVRYEHGQPSRTFATANEIRIPVGVDVRLRLDSPDVIHSLWVPSLNGKTDLIPGKENELHLVADRPGVYRAQCAEFCGLQHAHMALLVIAEPEDAFAAWRERQLRPAPEPASPSQRRGREVFLGSACAMCHAIRGTEAAAVTGPDLTHLAGRRTLGAGTLPNTRGHLAAWIADPQHVKPGNRMPITFVPPADLTALLDYLESLT